MLLFAPQTPLLFMGEEYGERRPFQFFTDHIDPAIAEATREGRRREFEFSGERAGPAGTFDVRGARSSTARSRDEELRAFYRELLDLRRELPREIEVEVDGSHLRARRGHAELHADFDTKTVEVRR